MSTGSSPVGSYLGYWQFMIKIDKQNTFQFGNFIFGGQNSATGISRISNGTFVLLGRSFSSGSMIYDTNGHNVFNLNVFYNYYFAYAVLYDFNGTPLSFLIINGNNNVYPSRIAAGLDDKFAISFGTFSSNITAYGFFNQTTNFTTAPSPSVYVSSLIEFDRNGTVLDYARFYPQVNPQISGLSYNRNKSLIVAGYQNSNTSMIVDVPNSGIQKILPQGVNLNKQFILALKAPEDVVSSSSTFTTTRQTTSETLTQPQNTDIMTSPDANLPSNSLEFSSTDFTFPGDMTATYESTTVPTTTTLIMSTVANATTSTVVNATTSTVTFNSSSTHISTTQTPQSNNTSTFIGTATTNSTQSTNSADDNQGDASGIKVGLIELVFWVIAMLIAV